MRLKRTINSFLSTLALLTRVSVRTRNAPDFSLTPLFVPVIGTLVGALTGLLYWGLRWLTDDLLIITLVILAIQYLTVNIFHFDGFVDSIDGLLCFAPREKKLRILKDVHIGAFALFFGALYVIGKVRLLETALREIDAQRALIPALFAFPVTGRIAASLAASFMKPAREDGLGAQVGRFGLVKTLSGTAISIAPLIVLTSLGSLPAWALIPLGAALPTFLLSFVAYRRAFGGITGDGLGFGVEVGELLHLLCFALLV
jgi:adenosylcobinamide-GDP ribazoletransferase